MSQRFAVWVWFRRAWLTAGGAERPFGFVLHQETRERARALLRTERLVETTDPNVAWGAWVFPFDPEHPDSPPPGLAVAGEIQNHTVLT